MRLLICLDCKTIEPLPNYDGPLERALVPAPDGTLQPAEVPPMGADTVLDHLSSPHARREHRGNLVTVEDEEWDDNSKRVEIIKQIEAGLNEGVAGLGADAYALKDTLTEDAVKCFNRHGRPEKCIDWHTRSKLLGNSLLSDDEKKAAKEASRAVAALAKKSPRGRQGPTKRYLCDFCPVATKVQQAMFDKKGLYS